MDASAALEAVARGQSVAGVSFCYATHVLGMTGIASWLVIESDGSVKERSMRMGQPPQETDLGRVQPAAVRALAEALVAQKLGAIAAAHKDAGPARRKTQISVSLGESEVAAELDTGIAETRADVQAIKAAFDVAKAAASTSPAPAPSPAPTPATPAASAPKGGCVLLLAALGILGWLAS